MISVHLRSLPFGLAVVPSNQDTAGGRRALFIRARVCSLFSRPVLYSTFSIVAFDAASESWGVAAQSAFLAVGAVVPWARVGVGAVATQAFANPRFGPLGLAMLAEGAEPEDVRAALIASDGGRELRQFGLVDRQGRAAAFTGRECIAWAGHETGDGYSCQGNILAGPEVVREMSRRFRQEHGLPFAERLVSVLEAGQAAGGDTRGQQSASLLVVRAGGGYAGYSDQVVNLRTDDHPTPIAELARLLRLHRSLFG